MTDTNALRPAIDMHLVRSALANGIAGLVLLTTVGLGLAGVLGLGNAFLPKAVAAYGVVLGIMAGFLRQHRPHHRLGSANQVTLVRGVLAALLAGFLGEGGTPAAAWTVLALALVAEALDGVDGHLARRFGWASPFGARFDMEIDALLVAVLAILLWSLDKAGPWVLAAGFLRYLFVGSGYLWPMLRRPLPPSRRRQAACVVQVLTLTVALAPVLPRDLSAPLAAAGLALLCWSFTVDILWLVRRAGLAALAGELP